jgi:hypothetical protein
MNPGNLLLLSTCLLSAQISRADLLSTTNASPAATPREAFERFAVRFKFIGVKELLYDRSEIYLADPAAMAEYLPALAEFRGRKDTSAEVIPLLEHPDAKVRVLAIMALYLKNEPHQTLPAIHNLVNDGAASFPDPPVDQGRLWSSGIGPPHEPGTVGEVARAVIDFYLRRKPNLRCAGNFEEYWAARKHRTACAGWFSIQMLQATHGASPLSEDAILRIRHLRASLAGIPAEDRRWIMLELARGEYLEYGTSYLADRDELSRLCHQVGSETLRQMIQADPKATQRLPLDPDLDLAALRWFIVEHARDLLSPDDAEAVLQAGNPIVAAELRPAMASKWLREPLANSTKKTQSWGEAQTAAALWRICGPKEAEFLLDWYFESTPERGAFPSFRAAFIGNIASQARPDLRSFLVRLVSDPRLKRTGPDSTRQLVLTIQPWLARPLVPADELHNSYGHDELDQRSAKFEPLGEWHQKLKESIPEWKPKR